ncbi:hypothetical protein PLESTF_001700300 [Pleodorina starrii]|nr:hypothetical protein PLESTF_001700300 [Pleodorina starrii]
MLFGNISYVRRHAQHFTFETTLRFLLTTLRSFNPRRLTSLLTAYPICRRATMALVLERFLTAGPFSEPEARLVVEMCQYLFKLHHRAAQTKRIIEFFHVSKSGGTSFCQLGRMNGCKTQSFDHRQNCLITYFRDAPRWTKAGALGKLSEKKGDPWCARYGRQYGMRWHCRARRQLMTRMRFNFYSNELVMHDHNRSWVGVHPCREFLNVVIFREPQSRVVSHMQNILKEYVAFYNESLWTAFDPNSPAQWRSLAVPVFDNYVVRSLLGGQAYNMPYGDVNATHLLAAKVVTMQFEVLLSLAPETSELTRDIFGLGLGWAFDLRHMHVRPTERRAVSDFGPGVMEAVRAAGALDEQLYDFALVLQLLDALAFGVAHDVPGPDGRVVQLAGGGSGSGGGARTAVAAVWLNSSEARGQAAEAAAAATFLNGSAAAAPARRRGRCGYVGARRKSSGRADADAEAAAAEAAAKTEAEAVLPPVAPALARFGLADAELHFALDGIGAGVIDGGRWFKGEFYRNETAALEAAAAAGRAVEAALVEELTAAAAAAATAAAAAAPSDEQLAAAAAAADARAATARDKATATAAAAAAAVRMGLAWQREGAG